MTKEALNELTKAKTKFLDMRWNVIQEMAAKINQLDAVNREMRRIENSVWIANLNSPGLYVKDPKGKPQYKEAKARKEAIKNEILEAGRLKDTEEAKQLREVAYKIGDETREEIKRAVYAIADLEDAIQEYMDDYNKITEVTRLSGTDLALDLSNIPAPEYAYAYMLPDDLLSKISELRSTRIYQEALAARRNKK